MKTTPGYNPHYDPASEYRAIILLWLLVLVATVLISCALPSGRPAFYSAMAALLLVLSAAFATVAIERRATALTLGS
jgi:hypothetical protein